MQRTRFFPVGSLGATTRSGGHKLLCANALAVVVGLSSAFLPQAAFAEDRSSVPALDAAAAKAHFAKAKDFYLAGNYKAAKNELEEAQRLDPSAKELVLNLANVCEKLGDLDEAAKWFEVYKRLPTVTADEQAKADISVRRIEGAKRAADEEARVRAAEAALNRPNAPVEKQVVIVEKPVAVAHGRMDALTVSLGVVGIAGLGVGGYFGVKALQNDPGAPSSVKLSNASTFNDYRAAVDRSQNAATVSTIALAVGGATLATAIIVYAIRPTAPRPKAGDISVGVGTFSVCFK